MFEHVEFAVIGDVIARFKGSDEFDMIFVVGVAREVEGADAVNVVFAVLDDVSAFSQ